ncbi:hypothetical protein [Bradyrhizobium oligotrophicum]|uniref:hypothetical protein n=1 Tax=Bradyrhizobium oligotrophicum TaxID=44255 RepID=UPI003EBD4A76
MITPATDAEITEMIGIMFKTYSPLIASQDWEDTVRDAEMLVVFARASGLSFERMAKEHLACVVEQAGGLN